jgi:hypothetical protein
MSNHVIHVKSCHSCQIMSFMSNHVILVKSCHSCQIMSFMAVIWAFSGQAFNKVGREGEGGGGRRGQICLPMPSATASLSGKGKKIWLPLVPVRVRLDIVVDEESDCQNGFLTRSCRQLVAALVPVEAVLVQI